jgi:hypothetical protein
MVRIWVVIGIFFGWQLLNAENFERDMDDSFISDPAEIFQEIATGQTLRINSATSLSGQMIVTSGGNRCDLKYRKRFKSANRQEALDFGQLITVEMEKTLDGVSLSFRAPTNAPWSNTGGSGRLEVEIVLPDSCSLEINTAYFDIDAYGPFANLTVSESLSRVFAQDVYNSTDIKVTSRPLILKNIHGNLFISNEYGEIKIENVDTGEQQGTIRNDHAEINITNFRGSIDLGNSYERITARNIFLTGTRNRIKNFSGPITLEFDSLTAGRLRINNNYGRTMAKFLGPVDARFICKNGYHSKIIADSLIMKPTIIEEGRLEFSSGSGEAEVRIYTRGEGDILIEGSKGI